MRGEDLGSGTKTFMSSLTLPDRPSLSDFQTYISAMVKERGFDHENVAEIFQLLLEECGELAKAARKLQNMRTDPSSKEYDFGHEAADVFMYLLDLCNRFDVDLEKAFREKEEVNKQRRWVSDIYS